MTVMSHQALFEAAWDRPLTDIAEGLGITSTGLKKLCDRHDVPTPGRGYWAQVLAGRTFPRPKLRPVKDPRLNEVRIVGAPPSAAVAAARQKVCEDLPRLRRPRAGSKTPADAAPATVEATSDADARERPDG